jgi:signal transduction histidine kinase
MTMSELIASIAHEVSQPLAAIVANVTCGYAVEHRIICADDRSAEVAFWF